MKKKVASVVLICVYTIIAIITVAILCMHDIYPAGTDTWRYLHSTNLLYKAFCDGSFYVCVDPTWYNGAQNLFAGAPLITYMMALAQYISGGSVLYGYMSILGIAFLISACGWLYIGYKSDKMVVGIILGFVWFLMPVNVYAIGVRGNVADALIASILPLLLYSIYRYAYKHSNRALLLHMFLLIMAVLCSVSFALTYLVTLLLIVLLWKIFTKDAINAHIIIGSLLITIVFMSGWIRAYVSSEALANIWNSASVGYCGIIIIVVAVFGALCSHRKTALCFLASLMIMAMSGVLQLTYFDSLQGMLCAATMVLISFIMWDTLKRYLVYGICMLFVIDIASGIYLFINGDSALTYTQQMSNIYEKTFIEEAKSITNQRMILLVDDDEKDVSVFAVSDDGDEVKCSNGIDNNNSYMTQKLIKLDDAMDQGEYLYIFDRCLELGDDTVLIQISQLQSGSEDIKKVTDCAKKLGYILQRSNSEYLLYHLKDSTKESFEVTSHYDAIGIGTFADALSTMYPDIEESPSANLNDYSYSELSHYKTVYLSGFTYDDKEAAEEIVRTLSENGVRVVISADGIQSDNTTRNQEFLGVTCNSMSFKNGYPIMYINNEEVDCELFADGYEKWDGVYLNGLDTSDGYLYENSNKISFLGTVENDNIIITGLNLFYHYELTHDDNIKDAIDDILQLNKETLPIHEIDSVTDEIKLNTFIQTENGLKKVKFYSPFILWDAVISALGVVFGIVFILRITRKKGS